MTNFRHVTDDISVSGQIGPQDVEEAARQGFRTIVNNRPDGEAPGQPSGHEIEAAAKEAGLAYFHLPVVGLPTPEQIETTRRIMEDATRPVLAYCRSGNRSIVTWSLSEAAAGAKTRDELLQIARQAGYDLSQVLRG